MEITLKRIDEHFKLEATNSRGDIMHTNGSPGLGSIGTGFRPMETLLIALAGCSAIDIINVLNKQRQRIENFEMKISGTKVEGTPSPFKTIDIHFIVSGKIKSDKMEKAIELTRTKYCSVYFSLHPDIDVRFHYEILD